MDRQGFCTSTVRSNRHATIRPWLASCERSAYSTDMRLMPAAFAARRSRNVASLAKPQSWVTLAAPEVVLGIDNMGCSVLAEMPNLRLRAAPAGPVQLRRPYANE